MNRVIDVFPYIVNFSLPLLSSMILIPVFLPFLKKLNFRQQIRELGPSSHQEKEGIPTLGGAIFFPVLLICSLLLNTIGVSYAVMLFVVFMNWLTGVADDLLKIRYSSSEGISGWLKLAVQALSGLIMGIFIYYSGLENLLYIPLADIWFEPGLKIIPFAMLVMMATTNSVNLSDGLDGLAGGLSIICLGFLIPFLLLEGASAPLYLALQGGGLMLGYLWFNFHPAQIFMGDAGSLMTGALIAVITLHSGMSLLLLLAGGVFVLEALSVILQVLYFKFTDGSRIFNMTPLHHHFELAGWHETKVTIRFFILQIVFGITALLMVFA